MLRVAQFGTGVTGKKTARGIVAHPDLELVGVVVTDPAKVGKDVGDLCGMPPIGLAATDSIDEVLALGLDCVCYMGFGPGPQSSCVEHIVRFLDRGVNVVSPSLYPALYPAMTPLEFRRPIMDACTRGESTFFVTGAAPGVMTLQLPVVLLSQADKVTFVRTQELFDYNHYNNLWVLGDLFGFGRPPEYETRVYPGDSMEVFRPELQQLAALLGVHIDRFEFRIEKFVTDHAVESVLGTLQPGTVTALLIQADAIVGGKTLLRHEHVTRMSDDSAPQWDRPSRPNTHAYTVKIEGSPPWFCEVSIDRDDPNRGTAGMHAVNAIPLVCRAAPGFINFADLPPYTTRNVVLAD